MANPSNNIALTLTPTDPTIAKLQQQMESLSPEERQRIDELARRVDMFNTAAIIRYGASAQKKSSQFSESMILGARGQELDTASDMIAALIDQIEGFKFEEDKKGFAKLFQSNRSRIAKVHTQYIATSNIIDNIKAALEGCYLTLLMGIKMLDQLFESNKEYFKELTIYILAGKQKLAEVKNGELVELQEHAKITGLPEDAQRVDDLSKQCDRFEKRIYDLELTRMICMQMAPQIRMIQDANIAMSSKIQTSIISTIPLWKNQVSLALNLDSSNRAMRAQRQVNNATDQLLSENAARLQQGVVEAAKESERGIVDIETLVHTNENVIATLNEVLAIQKNGKQRRAEAEAKLQSIERQLVAHLRESSADAPATITD